VREKGNKRMGGEDKRKTDRGVREREREKGSIRMGMRQ